MYGKEPPFLPLDATPLLQIPSEKSTVPPPALDISPNPNWGANPLATWRPAKWADSHPAPRTRLPIAQRIYLRGNELTPLLAQSRLLDSESLRLSLSTLASGTHARASDSRSVSSTDSGEQQWYTPPDSPSRDEVRHSSSDPHPLSRSVEMEDIPKQPMLLQMA